MKADWHWADCGSPAKDIVLSHGYHSPAMIPIVFHHGVLGFSEFRVGPLSLLHYFGGMITTAVADRGHPVVRTRVHPTASVATRARELKQTILKSVGEHERQIIIVAHSMGGLDARYMITHMGMAERVAALVTISTPHHGSPYADWCEKNLGQRLGGLRLARLLRLEIGAMHDLTTAACRQFNEQTPDSPLVRYYSISAAKPWYKLPAFAIPSWRVIHQVEGDNDCLVSVKSSTWGKHLGTWPCDHLHLINKRFALDPTSIGDVTPMYLKVLDQLHADGVEMRQEEASPQREILTPAASSSK